MGADGTELADVSLAKTVRTDTKTIWCVTLEGAVLEQWDGQVLSPGDTSREESEHGEE